jgi:hypothetical protein
MRGTGCVDMQNECVTPPTPVCGDSASAGAELSVAAGAVSTQRCTISTRAAIGACRSRWRISA